MYIFIVNPIAGNGRAKRIYNQLQKSSLYKQISSKTFFTKYKGHATEIVTALLKKHPPVTALIVIGGDGTLNDVINGMNSFKIPLAVIPGGSGNDFARGCQINKKPIELLEQIIRHKGKIDYWFGNFQSKETKKRFANNVGVGFDAEIAKKANESKYKRFLAKIGLSRLSYLFALVYVIFSFQTKTITVSYNGKKRRFDNCWLVTISNHPYLGGGMKLIPTAKIQSKVLPVLIIHSVPKWKVLSLFLTVFTGKHLNFKGVEVIKADKIEISSKEKVYFHADGEISVCKELVVSKESQAASILGSASTKHRRKI